jgi:cytochrome c oxidase cbb3-type subunit I/II
VGVPYTDGEIETAVGAMAREARVITAQVEQQKGPKGLEDKEVVALAAYLQRLGTDIRWKRAAPQGPDLVPASAPATPAASVPGGDTGAPAGQAPSSSMAPAAAAAVR